MFSQVIMLYNLNLYRAKCKLYLNKIGGSKTCFCQLTKSVSAFKKELENLLCKYVKQKTLCT